MVVLTRRMMFGALLAAAFLGLAGPGAIAQSDPLPSWNDGAAKTSITDFVARVTTQGGPGQDTQILVFKVYRDSFRSGDAGIAAVQSVVLMALVIALTVAQFRYIERKVHY